MKLSAILTLAAAVAVDVASAASAASAASGPTVYMIRHGEKPDVGDGLSAAGVQRAQCLRSVFGAASGYNIDYIMAMTPKSDGRRTRPLETVQPLAADLGLDVDTSCDRDDEKCVKKAVKAYAGTGTGNILICWEHMQLSAIAEKLGAPSDNITDYPDDRFDLVWTDPYDWSGITAITSEHCPGLDD